MRRRVPGLATLVLATLALATPAQAEIQAETWPARPIRMVVPWAPGQATDLGGRFVAQKLSESLGQTVVVENRPGAGGMIGTDAAAKAAPDGYTVLAASGGAVTLNPLVQRAPYDPERDLAPVAMIGLSPMVLVARVAAMGIEVDFRPTAPSPPICASSGRTMPASWRRRISGSSR